MYPVYKRLFQTLVETEPPAGLRERILTRIAVAKRRVARIRLALFLLVAMVSLFLLILALSVAQNALKTTGFPQYFSLLFSDGALVLAYWKEFAYSLAESIPALESAFVLSALLVFLWSLRVLATNVKNAFGSIHIFS